MSAAVVLDLDGDRIRNARIAFGGVGTKPWRSHEAELALVGARVTEATFAAAADAALHGAFPRRYNGFKIELAKHTLIETLKTVAALEGEQA